MFRTNVVKQEYKIIIQNKESKEQMHISIEAESLESAKLKISEGWEFVKEE